MRPTPKTLEILYTVVLHLCDHLVLAAKLILNLCYALLNNHKRLTDLAESVVMSV